MSRAPADRSTSPTAGGESAMPSAQMAKSDGSVEDHASAVEARPTDVGRRIRWARALTKLGRSDEAQAVLAAGLEYTPKSADLLFELAAHFLRMRRFDSAEVKIQALKKHHPGDRRIPQLRAAVAEARDDLDRAAALYAADVARHPDDSGQRLRWVRCLSRMGRTKEAEAALREGLRLAAAASAEMRVELSKQLLKTGRVAEVGEHLGELARHQQVHPSLRFLQVSEAEAKGDFDLAANLLSVMVAARPRDEKQRLRLAQCLVGAGRRTEALATVSEGLELRPTSADLLSRKVRLLQHWGQFDAAGPVIDALSSHHPSDPRLMQLKGEQAEASGEAEAAQAFFTIDLESAPDDPARRVRLAASLRKSGRIAEALSVLRPRAGESVGERKTRVECLLEIGDWEAARDVLEQWPQDDSPKSRQAEAQLRMRLAFLLLDFDTALDIAQSAVERWPHAGWAHMGAGRAAVSTFQAERAWKALLDTPRKSAGGGAGARGTAAPRSLVGQIVNEIRLRSPETTELRTAIIEGDEVLIEKAAAQMRADSGNFAAALALLTGLARKGRLAGTALVPSQTANGRIPPTLHQFWDTDPPPKDVARLMDETKRVNADCAYRRWSDADARKFLSALDWREPLRAYRVARHAAMKSDILRLAVLHAEGGFYLDADDSCTAPLRNLAPGDAEIVCYQEDFGSIGNNFLAASPGHPLIATALREAVSAVLEGAGESLWLVTGPGLISRVVAASIARTPDVRPPAGLHILPLLTFRTVVHPHRHVAYKKDKRHWSKAATQPQ